MNRLFALLSFLLVAGCSARVTLPDVDQGGGANTSPPEPPTCDTAEVRCGHQISFIPWPDDGASWADQIGYASTGFTIAVEPSRLWVCNASSQSLWSLPRSGGAAQKNDDIRCTAVVGDGSRVYVTGVGGHARIFATDGTDTPQPIVDLGPVARPIALVVGGEHLFWADAEEGVLPNRIRRAPKIGGAPEVAVDHVSLANDWSLAADDAYVFWLAKTSAGQSEIMRATHYGSAPTVLQPNIDGAFRAIALANDDVFFMSADSRVWHTPKTGGTAEWVGGPNGTGKWDVHMPFHALDASLYAATNGLDIQPNLVELRVSSGHVEHPVTRDFGADLIPDFTVDATALYELKFSPGGPVRVVLRPR